LKAAVIMGRMRRALRAYALATADPGEMLQRLENKMGHCEPDAIAPVLCAVFSPGLDQVAIANEPAICRRSWRCPVSRWLRYR
jgi:hypothetical protein